MEIVNPYGQKLSYQYDLVASGAGAHIVAGWHADVTVHLAVYPKLIVYPHGRYLVSFEREAERTDYDQKWDDDTSSVMYQAERLKYIHIQHDADGYGTGANPATVRTIT